MALKAGHTVITQESTTDVCDSVSAPGFGLVYSTAGSGTALGDSKAHFVVPTNPSGLKFAGMLRSSVVNLDQTRFHRNFYKDEQQTGMPVNVLLIGREATNCISGTPAGGEAAFLTTNGNFTPTMSATGGVAATPRVGKFVSAKDEDGYAVVAIDVNSPGAAL